MNGYIKNRITNDKDRIVIYNIISAFLIKGASLLITILTLPALISYFNDEEVLGVWFTILSILTWILTFDMGIGNGLRNKLVEAIVINDLQDIRKSLSSAYFLIGLITLISFILSIVIFPKVEWNDIFNLDESKISQHTLSFVMFITYLTIILQFFFRTISFIVYAIQKSSINNLVTLITSILILIFIILIPSYDLETNFKLVSIIYLFCVNVPLIILTLFIFSKYLNKCYPSFKFINKASMKEIMSLGGIFFWNQIMYAAIMQTNLMFITFNIGPKYVVEYQVYLQIFMLVGTIFSLALTPMWSAITKAFAEKDFHWIYKYFTILNKIIFLSIIFMFLMIPFLQPLVDLWLKKNTIEIQIIKAILFAIFGSLFLVHNVLSTFVSGLGKLKLQAYFYTFGVIIKFAIIIKFSTIFSDWIIILLADILILLPYCIVQWFVLNRSLKSIIKANGV